jgi:rhodanese-related sulfurtransferase
MNGFFNNCKLHISGIDYVLPSEALELLGKGACLVDLRTDFETEIKAFGLERVVYLPYEELEEKYELLSRKDPLILADSVGLHSKEALVFLKSKGFIHLASLAGGIAEWEKDGFPVSKGRYQPLNGPCPCMIKPRKNKE